MGLDGLLSGRSGVLSGILNGIDTVVWDPATDSAIAANYNADGIRRRAANKTALQQRFGLHEAPEALLLGVISRLSWQKGLDLLLETLPIIVGDNIQLALLGSGDADLQAGYLAAAAAHPDQVGVRIGYDENLAHLIQAGADALVVPSRFEPCGLTQLCALRYGAVPVVANVGGLADTVIDVDARAGAATGIKFGPVTSANLGKALERANALFRSKPEWLRLQRNGMASDVSWRDRAGRYAELYREIVKTHQG
jgi:starch synthase